MVWPAAIAALALLLASAAAPGNASQDCCTSIPKKAKDCIDACQKVWMSNGPLQRLENMAFVYMSCPATRNWEQTSACLNSTYSVIRDVEIWEGRACCELAATVECRIACEQALSADSLSGSCHKAQEKRLHSCLARQEGSRQCCRPIVASMPHCRMACRAVFAHSGTQPSPELAEAVHRLCGDDGRGSSSIGGRGSGSTLTQCIANHSHSAVVGNLADSLLCCQRSESLKCKEACNRSLLMLQEGQQMINAMIPDCGVPQPPDPMWGCFMLSSYGHPGYESDSRSAAAGAASRGRSGGGLVPADPAMDGVRLLCCSHARKTHCKQLCWQMYAGAGLGGSSSAAESRTAGAVWGEFSRQCQYDPGEAVLAHCLQEVEEPCSPGCSGLQFCQAFNDRPTDMFRTCTAHADQAARRDYEQWARSRVISFPNGFKIALKDPTTCNPDLWKAVACALQVKPCKRQSHSSRICKSDCLSILTKCVDFTQLPDQNANSLCEHLPVSDKEECINLSSFTEVNRSATSAMTTLPSKGVTHPCRPNPCNSSQVCEVNRQPCASNEQCKPYVCLPACLVSYALGGATAAAATIGGGESALALSVKHGYHVRMPDASSARLSWVCHQLCTCHHTGAGSGGSSSSASSGGIGLIGQCSKLDCTAGRPEDCYVDGGGELAEDLSEGRRIEHGQKVVAGCKECTCHAGELTCTSRSCDITAAEHYSGVAAVGGGSGGSTNTGLPCRCPSDYAPVCAKNGKTYANRCLAQCAGIAEDYSVTGSCASRNPCRNNPCGAGYKCVPKKHTCLGTEAECQQYECISSMGSCNLNANEPVCDSKGLESRSLCILLQNRKQLAYRGHCMSHCEHEGVVCGVNGETYSSECVAWADRVLADYEGPCKAVGNYGDANSAVAGIIPISSTCHDVTCPAKEIVSSCKPIIPPGACCPVCGAELRTSYSKRQLKSLSGSGHSTLTGSHPLSASSQTVATGGLPVISVSDIADHLRQYVTVAECDVFSYLSIEDEIVILIVPVVRNPTPLQVCNIACVSLRSQ